jgi:hypothetical protein
MPTYTYVSLQDEDKILMLAMDATTGRLTPRGEVGKKSVSHDSASCSWEPSRLSESLEARIL